MALHVEAHCIVKMNQNIQMCENFRITFEFATLTGDRHELLGTQLCVITNIGRGDFEKLILFLNLSQNQLF